MQIHVTPNEVRDIVLGHIQESFNLDDSNNFVVEMHDDGTVAVIVNEEAGDLPERESQPAGERPAKKPRRTKAQIEADNKAEAERLAQAQEAAASGNGVVSIVKPDAEAPVVETEAAGETTQEASDHGEEAATDPIVDTSVGVEEEQSAAEETAQVEVETEAPAVKPAGVSLFQNLRRPNNG